MAATQPRRRAPPPPPPARPEANGKKKAAASAAATSSRPASPVQEPLEGTVKKLRLTKTLTLPEATTVSEACRLMAAKRVDATLLTDSNGRLSGILTAEDISGRVIAEGHKPEETNVVKVMTRNPVFVMSNSPAIDALQKMVKGKFRHLPVVENGEVSAMLDITKFLYDAISRMEKAAEQGSAIAAAMDGVEQQWGNEFAGTHALIEKLLDHMFKPSLSTIITENSSVPVVSPSDPVTEAAKKMREYRVNSVFVMTGDKLIGILTAKDLVLRVVAQGLSPDVTLVKKAMTANPECATIDTSILEALQSMKVGKFRHIPVTDKNGQIVACLDALQLTHAAISIVDGASGTNDMADISLQKFWRSALALRPAEEPDAPSEDSNIAPSDSAAPHVADSFSFKIKDREGRTHRFSCVSECLDELVSSVAFRIGMENEKATIKLTYVDDEGDRVLLATDSDLSAAIQHARSAGRKVLKLHIDNCRFQLQGRVIHVPQRRWPFLRFGIAVGAVALVGGGVIIYLKRSERT